MDILKRAFLACLRIAFFGVLRIALFAYILAYILFLPDTTLARAVTKRVGQSGGTAFHDAQESNGQAGAMHV